MRGKRAKIFPITTADQLRVISSPVPLSIVQTLQQTGPASIRVLGPKIGRSSNSLHYHIRKLLKLGMIQEVGTRQSGSRTESIYDVVADRFKGLDVSKEPALQEPVNRSVAALLRLAARNFADAAGKPSEISEKGAGRNIGAQRHMSRLTKKQLFELNTHIEGIEKLFRENIGSDDGQMLSLTLVLAPISTNEK